MSGDGIYAEYTCINRIRLEFKGDCGYIAFLNDNGINRIRLEFKVCDRVALLFSMISINRIRLEFKVVYRDVQVHICIQY